MQIIKTIIASAIVTAVLCIAGSTYAALVLYPTGAKVEAPVQPEEATSTVQVETVSVLVPEKTQSVSNVKVTNVQTLSLQDQINLLNKRLTVLENSK